MERKPGTSGKPGRPRAEDPSVALTIRLPRSVLEVWEKKAADKGVGVRELIQSKLREDQTTRPRPVVREPEAHVHEFKNWISGVQKYRCDCGEWKR